MSSNFFLLLSPFVFPLVGLFTEFSIRFLCIMTAPIFLESFLMAKLLYKQSNSWKYYKSSLFIAFQLFLMHCVAMIVEIFCVLIMVMLYWKTLTFVFSGATPQELSQYSNNYAILALSLVGAGILLLIRWKIFCKMYGFFDNKINQKVLFRTMFYVVLAGYFFMFMIIQVNNFNVLNLNL